MDTKIKTYQHIITDLLNKYAAAFDQGGNKEVKSQVICDFTNNHFQLLRLGWHNGQYRFSVIFHFDIINEKIWLQQNRTDILIAKELVGLGVPQHDIVLGLQPPEARPFTEYAVA